MFVKLNGCWMLLMAVLALPLAGQAQDEAPPKALPEGTIRFDNFTGQPWMEIIEMYAQQAGLELDKVESAPTGTFEFRGNRDMTYLEALDFLNEKLIPRERILVRKRHMLYLFDISKGIPESMIQTVLPEDLDERGKYELLKCKFDVKGLDASELRNQIEGLIDDVHRRNMTTVPLANLIILQETGGKLRFIRDNIINVARENTDNWEAVYIKLEHAIPEDVIDAAVQNLGLNRETRRTEDGTLSISIHPHGDKILATGDPATIGRLQKLVNAVNQPFENPTTQRVDPYYFSYPVSGNVELIHEVLQSMMSGRDIKLDFDEKTNRIHLFGRPDDHDDVNEVIEKTGRGSGNFSVVQVDVMEIEEAREKIEEAFGLGSLDAPEGEPTITELPPNRLVIRGNPGDVTEIVQLLNEIDVRYTRDIGTRTIKRDINMTSAESDRIMGMLSDVIPSMRLPNQIDVVMPGEQKWKYNRQNRAFEIYRGDEIIQDALDRQKQLYGPQDRGPDPQSQPQSEAPTEPPTEPTANPPANRLPKKADHNKQSFASPPRSYRLQEATVPTPPRRIAQSPDRNYISTIAYQLPDQESAQEQEPSNGSGRASNEIQDEIQTEPGAPITLYVNDRGITVYTKDLDAGDALEDIILDELSRTSTNDSMQLFLLKYREAADAKAQLERYLGMGGGGGGGGGMSDMMGGFMRNALPGAAGGMAEALLGGGGAASDSGGAVRELAGAVTIVADAKQYSLLIAAMPEDMQLIEQLIDLIDQPTAIQNPNPNGRTQLIKINYIEPETLEAMVRANLAAVLRNAEEANGQNQGGNAEARMQQQMLRQLLGGRGGGGGDAEQEAPKAALSVDKRNNMLVVTGPDFIYDQIREFVSLVDTPVVTNPSVNEFISVGDIDINLLAEILQAQNPNIELLIDQEGTATTTGSGSPTAAGQPAGGAANPISNNDAFRNAIMQGMRGQQRGGGGRGGGGRGGRGGGGRGGGGTFQRGGR